MEKNDGSKKSKKEKIKYTITFLLASYLIFFGVGPLQESDLSKSLNLEEPSAIGSSMIEIPDKYKNIAPGDELVAEISFYQFDYAKKRDVILDFEIQDLEGKEILKQHETVAVETQASFLKTFALPIDMSPGKYTLFSSINNLDSSNITTSTASFDISKPLTGYKKSNSAPFYSKNIFLTVGLALLLLLIFIACISLIKKKNSDLSTSDKKINKKIEYKDLIEAIIRNNRFFGGQKAIELANRVKGLEVSEDGYVQTLEKREVEIMIVLIDLYRISIGQSSIKIARKAVELLHYQNSNLIIPNELMPTE